MISDCRLDHRVETTEGQCPFCDRIAKGVLPHRSIRRCGAQELWDPNFGEPRFGRSPKSAPSHRQQRARAALAGWRTAGIGRACHRG